MLSSIVPDTVTRDVDRIVGDGVVLFVRSENQSWVLCRSRPSTGDVRALIRTDMRGRFLEAVKARGGKPLALQSAYSEWLQVDEFASDELPLDEEWTRNIRCLDETITPPRIGLSDGVMLPNGWLGLRGCLPRVTADADSVTIEHRTTQSGAADSAELQLRSDGDSSGYAIPSSFGSGQHLSGRYILRAKLGNDVVAVRPVDFRAHAYGHDYRTPSNPARWLVESSLGDMVGLTSETPPSWEQRGSVTDVTRDLGDGKPLRLVGEYGASDGAQAFGEALAAIGSRRQGIDEPELIEWIGRTMGVRGSLAWDVARSWVEAGFLDCLVYRHWKKRTYYPRAPRLVIHRVKGVATVFATVVGLLPILSRRDVEEAAAARGLHGGYCTQSSPWVLPPLLLVASDEEVFENLRAACRLGPNELLPSLESCTVPIAATISHLNDTPLGYESSGVWDWTVGRFAREEHDSGPHLERLVRTDAPDVYVVRTTKEKVWHGWSRTWGFLIAASSRAMRLVERHGDSTVRIAARGVRLPMSIGRWSTAKSGICPGPSGPDGSSHDYLYTLSVFDPVARVEEILLDRRQTPQWSERARWLAVLASARTSASIGLTPVPPHARRIFALHSKVPALRQLAGLALVPRELLPQLLALTREIHHAM